MQRASWIQKDLASKTDFPPSCQPTAPIFIALQFADAFVSHHKCQRATQLLGLWGDCFSFYSKRSMRFTVAVFLKIYNQVSWQQYVKTITFRQNITEEITNKSPSQALCTTPQRWSTVTRALVVRERHHLQELTLLLLLQILYWKEIVLTSEGLAPLFYTVFCCWITAVNSFLEGSLASQGCHAQWVCSVTLQCLLSLSLELPLPTLAKSHLKAY